MGQLHSSGEREDTAVQSAAGQSKTPQLLAHNQGAINDICDSTSHNEQKRLPLSQLHNFERGDTPPQVVARQCKTTIIPQLLPPMQCNIDEVGDTQLQIDRSKTVPVYQLHECERGDTPLHIAARQSKATVIPQLLADKKCNINALNEIGDTPLHVAIKDKMTIPVSQLLASKQCDPNILNEDAETPLHIAVKQRQDYAVFQLLSCEKCCPNVQNRIGDTALHIAVRNDNSIIPSVSRLLANKQCNPNVQNEDGDTPLHIAVRNDNGKTTSVTRLLASKQCNPNIQNKNGDTPLHIAVRQIEIAEISLLLAHQQCGVNVQNKDGDTSIHIAFRLSNITASALLHSLTNKEWNPNVQNNNGDTPLHIAVREEITSAISLMLTNDHCNPNVQNTDGDTPLHIAVRQSRTATIYQLLAHQMQCSSNVQNKEGNTPLHLACYKRLLDVIKLLAGICTVHIPNKKGETAQDIPLNEDGDCLLHIACQWGDVDIVRHIITDERCNPNVQNTKTCTLNIQNKNGDTPLHIAARNNMTLAVSQLLKCTKCEQNILNNDHLTPLLIAIKHNNPTAATALLQHKKCDATLCDPHGNTSLHLACIGGETQPEMVKVAKQLLSSLDPMSVNNAGQTPIELTTNYQLIQAISYFVKYKTKQSVQTYINMFIVGNPETGKSTLVKAICKEATSILWKIVPKQVRRVKNVPLHTAGIIPTKFRSKTFGNTVLYDLAGQIEYYTSHAAVIRSTVISTPPAFIIVVNLSESDEKISQTLRYWWSFIDNHAAQSSAPPEVILVGSHADIVNSTGRSALEKMTQVSDLMKQLPSSFHFAGQVALDCRDPASRELQLFCSLVDQSCTILRQTADVDLRCHVLYAFLLEKFKQNVACTVSDVVISVKETSALLPRNPDSLIPLLSTLSDKGLLLLVKGGEICEDWWIILQKQALLGKINGVIFAPKYFKQHKDLSWSTGVVPFSKLKNEFPDYNPNMVSEFLIHLEFCFKIEDHDTLALLKNEDTDVNSLGLSEEYYFFPGLVSIENPLHVWEQNHAMYCRCCWFYQCIRHDQFLTTQFLHVLILRLAFTFALELDPGDCRQDTLSLRRKCSVWKHGIGWLNCVPIETVVEVGLQCQSVIVMMCCPKGEETKCIQLRSKVIQKVLETKHEYCKAVEMSESFIDPKDVEYPFNTNVDNVKCYTLTEIARVIAKRATNVLDQRGRNPLPAQDLLLFDPFNPGTSTGFLQELFSEKHSMVEKVRCQVLESLNAVPQKSVIQDMKSEATCAEPTLPELLKFTCTDERTINVSVEIATKYLQFGTFLLDDRNGSRIKIMARKHHYDAEQINMEILQEWLNGRGKHPVTWTTFVQVLDDIEMSTLARDIEAVKCPVGPVSKGLN